jgi:tetratricopeptide (TPR) repeat protein
MKIILTHIKGSQAGSKTEYESPFVRVGRDPRECDLAFNSIQEPGVSRLHAVISFYEGNFYLEDLNSRNGTYLDQEQIEGKVTLKKGNFIQFGVEGPIVQFEYDANFRPKAPSTQPVAKVEDTANTISCPTCEAQCSGDAKFCRRCGSALMSGLSAIVAQADDDPEITMVPMSKQEREAIERKRIIETAIGITAVRSCAVCGANIIGEAKFCAACGASIKFDSSGLAVSLKEDSKSLSPQPATSYVSIQNLPPSVEYPDKRVKSSKKDSPTVADLSEKLPANQPSTNVKSVEKLMKIELPQAQRQGPLIPPNPVNSPSSLSPSNSIVSTEKKAIENNLPLNASISQPLSKGERTFSPGYTLLLSAQALAKEGKSKLAMDECQRALELDPHLPEIYQFMGQLLLADGESKKAIEAFEKAIKLQPSLGEVYADLGQAYLRSGRYEDAAKSAREAIKIDQVNPSAFYTIGLALMEMGDFPHAYEAFSRAIKLKTDYAEAYLGAANTQFRTGRADEAIKSCQQAIKINPKYHQAYCLLGQCYRAKKQFVEAQKAFKDAIKIKPDYSIAYNYLALNYRSQGNLDEAEAAGYKAVALDPNIPENHNTMGLLYGERGQYREAIMEYKCALKLRANYAEAYNNIGLCYFKTNELQRAVEHFEKALELEPQFILARVNLALCYFKLSDKANVKKHYHILYELDETRAAKLYQKIKPLLIS